MEHTKMVRTAQVLDKFTKVLSVLFLVAGILMVVCGGAGAIALALGWSGLGQGGLEVTFGLTFNPLSLELADGAAVSSGSYYTTICGAILVGGLFVLAVSRVGFRAIRAILAPMTEGRPFEESGSRALRTLAWLTLVGGAVLQIGSWVVLYLTTRAVDVSALFATEAVAEVSFRYTLDVNFILYAAILFLLSYVFRYGEVLQRESDETV